MMPVTINQGFVMRAWFDIRTADIAAEIDEKGIRASAKLVDDLIAKEIDNGIAPERVVLAGFSQGGAIVLQAGLRYEKQLGGIMALSTFLPLADSLESEKSDANAAIQIFQAHGSEDPVVPVDLAYGAQKVLEREGYEVEWHEYKGMAHSVSEQEIFHLAEWLEQRLT
jgi:phospholipase/carboxylesterase